MTMTREIKQAIEAEARRLGFEACGFAKAGPVSTEMTAVLDHWTACGYHADMQYMERNRHLRLDRISSTCKLSVAISETDPCN